MMSARTFRRGERGAALVIAILVLSILTVVGIALMLVTSTESRIAANEWSVNRAFYASDAGIRWGTVEMANPQDFLRRPEFTGQPFGTVFFQLPSHRNTLSGLFLGDQTNPDIAVRIQTPSMMGRRHALGGRINEGDERAQFYYSWEMRSASSDQAFASYAKALVAQVDVGPLPARLPF
jgi:hypothetical protein